MSGKSCGIPSNQIPQRRMLGSGNLYNKQKTNNTTLQIVNAIKENRKSMVELQKKTEHLEQNLLIQRSLEKSNVESKMIEEVFDKKLDLVKGDFKEQMTLLKNYIKVLEAKIKKIENKIVKKTPVIPKKNQNKQEQNKQEQNKENDESKKENDESKKEKDESKKEDDKEDDKEEKNVTLEIKEK